MYEGPTVCVGVGVYVGGWTCVCAGVHLCMLRTAQARVCVCVRACRDMGLSLASNAKGKKKGIYLNHYFGLVVIL